MFNVSDLKVGDEVCIEPYYSYASKQFTKVSRVTPTGIITVESKRRFNSDGLELGTTAEKHRRDRLVSAESARADIARMKRIHAVDSQVTTMKEALDYLHTPNGHYWISTESLQLINQLTASLQKPQNGYASDLPGKTTPADAA